jgi:hypothetical protein
VDWTQLAQGRIQWKSLVKTEKKKKKEFSSSIKGVEFLKQS